MDARALDLVGRGYRFGAPAPERLTPEEWEELADAGIAAPDDAGFTDHAATVARGRAAVAALDRRAVADAFVVGLSRTWPRGLSALGSYAVLRHLPDHPFAPFDGPPNHVHPDHAPTSPVCATCGRPPAVPHDRTWSRWWMWQGLTFGDTLEPSIVDLEELAGLTPPAPTADDRSVLRRLIEVLTDLPPGTSLSAAEKEVGRAKVLPPPRSAVVKGAPALQRRAVLTVLADAGVLAQDVIPARLDAWWTAADELAAYEPLGLSFRNDVMLPVAAWRGAVDHARVADLFGELSR